MNKEKITELEKKINNEYSNIAGIVILKDGKTLYENYFNECTATSRIHVYSVTKSIISILIGIAMDKGYIKVSTRKYWIFSRIIQLKQEKKRYRMLHLRIC